MIALAFALLLAQPAGVTCEQDFATCARAVDLLERQELDLRELLEIRDAEVAAQAAQIARLTSVDHTDPGPSPLLVGGAGVVAGALLTVAIVLILR